MNNPRDGTVGDLDSTVPVYTVLSLAHPLHQDVHHTDIDACPNLCYCRREVIKSKWVIAVALLGPGSC